MLFRTRGSSDGSGAKDIHNGAVIAEVAVIRVHTDEEVIELSAELELDSELKLEALLFMALLPETVSLGASVTLGDSSGPVDAPEGISGTVIVTWMAGSLRIRMLCGWTYSGTLEEKERLPKADGKGRCGRSVHDAS